MQEGGGLGERGEERRGERRKEEKPHGDHERGGKAHRRARGPRGRERECDADPKALLYLRPPVSIGRVDLENEICSRCRGCWFLGGWTVLGVWLRKGGGRGRAGWETGRKMRWGGPFQRCWAGLGWGVVDRGWHGWGRGLGGDGGSWTVDGTGGGGDWAGMGGCFFGVLSSHQNTLGGPGESNLGAGQGAAGGEGAAGGLRRGVRLEG
jgi:hypothetical protein